MDVVKLYVSEKSDALFDQYYNAILRSFSKHYLSHDELVAELKRDNIKLLPTFINTRLIATCSLCIEKENHGYPYYASIHRLTVDPEFRGLGYGYLTNKKAFEYAKEIGCEHIYCSVVANVEGKGGGNKPNLRELDICINKLKYKPTGYRFVDLPDFGRIKDKQYTSTIVVWRNINNEEKTNYHHSLNKLFDYYNNSKNFKIFKQSPDNFLTLLPPKKTGAEIACSSNIEHFSHSNFLPTYFLPKYGDNKETVFFGFRYHKILTRVANGTNIADFNYEELSQYLKDDSLLNLAKIIQKKITARSEIVYSDPIIKIRNL